MGKKAFLFDLNGTMIDDMQYHLKIWHDVVTNELGAKLTLEEMRNQMYGKNDELLTRVFGEGRFTQAEVEEISRRKEIKYQEMYRPHLDLLPGLFEFLNRADQAGIKMAIGSAAIPFNIDFVLDNLHIRKYFRAVVSAHDVLESKPHPEVFVKAADLIQVDPHDCVVFEDAPKGVEAARNAGMEAVAITTMHSADEFSAYTNILCFVKDYTDPALDRLFPRQF